MAEDQDNVVVTFTVKELLMSIERKLDTVMSQLFDKVDRREVAVLTARITKLEADESVREAIAANHKLIARWSWKMTAAIGTIIAFLLANGAMIAKLWTRLDPH